MYEVIDRFLYNVEKCVQNLQIGSSVKLNFLNKLKVFVKLKKLNKLKVFVKLKNLNKLKVFDSFISKFSGFFYYFIQPVQIFRPNSDKPIQKTFT